jgi:molybdopterin biosynthesis enzyme
LVARCDAVLRIGGASSGADDMVATAQQHGKQVFYRLEDVPAA